MKFKQVISILDRTILNNSAGVEFYAIQGQRSSNDSTFDTFKSFTK